MAYGVGAHELFEGQPVGPLHALDEAGEPLCVEEDDDDEPLDLVTVSMSWGDTEGRRCPECDVLAAAFGGG